MAPIASAAACVNGICRNVVGKPFATYATGYVPVPDNATCCGLPAALSATLSAAPRVPVAVGLNGFPAVLPVRRSVQRYAMAMIGCLIAKACNELGSTR